MHEYKGGYVGWYGQVWGCGCGCVRGVCGEHAHHGWVYRNVGMGVWVGYTRVGVVEEQELILVGRWFVHTVRSDSKRQDLVSV